MPHLEVTLHGTGLPGGHDPLRMAYLDAMELPSLAAPERDCAPLSFLGMHGTPGSPLTRLIGLIAHEARLEGFVGTRVCGAVKVYRDKVAAHFARVSAHNDDNPADRASSIIDDLTWITDRFWVGAVRVHVGAVSPSRQYTWSLTKFHEDQAARYLPPCEQPSYSGYAALVSHLLVAELGLVGCSVPAHESSQMRRGPSKTFHPSYLIRHV
jgi:hypothetical protein